MWDAMSQTKLITIVLSAFFGVGAITASNVVASDGRATQVDFF